MRKFTYEELYKNEEKYWWFIGTREIIFDQLENHLDIKKNTYDILDIGCGTGLVLYKLGKYGNAIGIDNSTAALSFCKARGLKNVLQGNATELPFSNGSFDLITALDLLEHVSDDRLVLEEIYRVLRHEGIAVITVPAFRFLWSGHDNALMHFRRYQKKELQNKLENSKFNVLKISYYNCFLFPIITGIRVLKNLTSKKAKNRSEETDIIELPRPINRFLIFILKLEKLILKNLNFPFGVSLISVIRK